MRDSNECSSLRVSYFDERTSGNSSSNNNSRDGRLVSHMTCVHVYACVASVLRPSVSHSGSHAPFRSIK